MEKNDIFFHIFTFVFNLHCLHCLNRLQNELEGFQKTAHNKYLSFETINKVLDKIFWSGSCFLWPSPKFSWRATKKWKFHLLPIYRLVTYQNKAADFRIANMIIRYEKSRYTSQQEPKKPKKEPKSKKKS